MLGQALHIPSMLLEILRFIDCRYGIFGMYELTVSACNVSLPLSYSAFILQ